MWWKSASMTPSAHPASPDAGIPDDNSEREQAAPTSVREAFTRAAQEMRVSRGQLERILPEWTERGDEPVLYEEFHRFLRHRIVEALRPDG